MSRLLPEFENASEVPLSEVLSIEQEIECPRCHDLSTLLTYTLNLIDSVIIVTNVAFRCI